MAKHGTNIARIIVARMLLQSIFKMLKDEVRFNQVSAAQAGKETATALCRRIQKQTIRR